MKKKNEKEKENYKQISRSYKPKNRELIIQNDSLKMKLASNNK